MSILRLDFLSSLNLTILYSITLTKSFQKACETKTRRNVNPLRDVITSCFFFIPHAAITVATEHRTSYYAESNQSQYRTQLSLLQLMNTTNMNTSLSVTIPHAVITVATADLENPCLERLSKPDLANQMNFCYSFQEN